MRSVAQGAFIALFTGAKKYLAVFFGGVLDRGKLGALMRSVAEWLFAALPARAPKIVFSLFNFYRHWRSCGYCWFGHVYILSGEFV